METVSGGISLLSPGSRTPLNRVVNETSRYIGRLHELARDYRQLIDRSTKLIDESWVIIRSTRSLLTIKLPEPGSSQANTIAASGIKIGNRFALHDGVRLQNAGPRPDRHRISFIFTRHESQHLASSFNPFARHQTTAPGFALRVRVLQGRYMTSKICTEAIQRFIREITDYYTACSIQVSGRPVLTRQMVAFALPGFSEPEIDACLKALHASGLIQITGQAPLEFVPAGPLAG